MKNCTQKSPDDTVYSVVFHRILSVSYRVIMEKSSEDQMLTSFTCPSFSFKFYPIQIKNVLHQIVYDITPRLNGFTIWFNMPSTLFLTKCWGRLNRPFNIVESVIKKFGKLVESVLNQIEIGSNFHSIPFNISFVLDNVEWYWSRLNIPFNIYPTSRLTFGERMLKPFKRAFT